MKKFKKGEIVSCEITGLTNYGVFVNLSDDYTGLIHISELSYTFIDDVKRIFEIGQKLNARVIECDDETKQVKLSLKDSKKNYNTSVIKEKGRGFKPLKENLDMWVNEKIKELDKISKTP